MNYDIPIAILFIFYYSSQEEWDVRRCPIDREVIDQEKVLVL